MFLLLINRLKRLPGVSFGAMRVHTNKPGLRALGIAESFSQGNRYSVISGVVMRADLVIDGVSLGRITVGGNDSTDSIFRLYRSFSRNDINLIMLSGCILGYYNIVDLDLLSEKVKRPVICLTYKESKGIEDTIRLKFPEDRIKIQLYKKLGDRKVLKLETGKRILVRVSGINERNTLSLLNRFTLQGSIPEPVRVAKLIARSVRKHFVKSL
jgi:endonuclease V-like protein UPF0215 family